MTLKGPLCPSRSGRAHRDGDQRRVVTSSATAHLQVLVRVPPRMKLEVHTSPVSVTLSQEDIGSWLASAG